MNTEFLSNAIKSDFVTFPVDDINLKNNKVCLIRFFNFLELNTNLSYDQINDVCECVREYISNSRSFFIDKDSNICIRLGGSK